MDFHTFQMLRSACRGDLAQYIDAPDAGTLLKLNLALHGDLAKLKWEADQAESLYACDDLTLRERAAAHLLAVACNHRAIAWNREPEPPNGREQAKPLSPEQSAALWTQTREAVNGYAVHLPEREAEWLRAQVDEKPAESPISKMTETVAERRARWLAMLEAEEKICTRGALQRVADREGVDRANMSKDIKRAREARTESQRQSLWTSQLVKGGKR